MSATWAAGASDGWQQVKIRRSRSSRTGPSASGAGGSSAAASATASCWRSSRVVSRRKRSIPRRRAVVMIQPAGLGGTPSCGQRLTASTNASWTASSAASMSPKTRTRTATARPYSSRKTRSMSTNYSWSATGRTSIGSVLALAIFPAQPSAASRSGASISVKPPMCSLASVNGPSVISVSPS